MINRMLLLSEIVVALAATLSFAECVPAAEHRFTVQLSLKQRTIQGTVLASNDQQVCLLATDGELLSFHPDEASNFRRISDQFRPVERMELRRQLLQEFGPEFQVVATAHYLVVASPRKVANWSNRFEELYRGFVHYFRARGFSLTEPEFPLVAVAFPTAAEFHRYARQDGANIGSGVLGYYSPRTNRIVMYEQTSDLETIIHEATHQSAFNTGIHSRFALTPLWLVEGLGTLFESRGVWDSQKHSQFSDRLHPGRLAQFRAFVESRRQTGTLAELIASDRLFQTDPGGAYAESWAFAFYLSEAEPAKFQQLLRQLATTTTKSPGMQTERERLQAFSKIFGSDLRMLETRFLRYFAELK